MAIFVASVCAQHDNSESCLEKYGPLCFEVENGTVESCPVDHGPLCVRMSYTDRCTFINQCCLDSYNRNHGTCKFTFN